MVVTSLIIFPLSLPKEPYLGLFVQISTVSWPSLQIEVDMRHDLISEILERLWGNLRRAASAGMAFGLASFLPARGLAATGQ